MRLPPHLVAALAQLLEQPDPADLISPIGARRAHVLRLDGRADRFDSLLYTLQESLRRRRAQRLGAIDEAHR